MSGSTSSDRVRAALAVAAGAAIIGLAPIGMRLSEVGPMATAMWRFLFALPLLLALNATANPSLAASRSAWPTLALAGLCFGLDIVLWHAALTQTSVLNATMLSNMTPVLAAAGGWLFLRERVTGAFAIGAGVALVGALLLTTARAQAGSGALVGDLLGLASAVWYAAYLVILRQARRTVGVRAAMLATTAVSAVVAFAATLMLEDKWAPTTLHGWLILAGLGLVVHTGGQGLIAYGVGRLPIALSTVLLWVQPLAAAGLGWIIFGEALGPLAFLGAAFILGGVWIVQRGRS